MADRKPALVLLDSMLPGTDGIELMKHILEVADVPVIFLSAYGLLRSVTIDYPARRVTLAGRPVQLTATEYGLLAELSANAGRVLTHQQLLDRVWGEKGYDGDVRPMRPIVSKLRRKLGEDAEHPRYIFTEPRVGFRMPTGEVPDGSRPRVPGAETFPLARIQSAKLTGE